jgi:hypothetical protein
MDDWTSCACEWWHGLISFCCDALPYYRYCLKRMSGSPQITGRIFVELLLTFMSGVILAMVLSTKHMRQSKITMPFESQISSRRKLAKAKSHHR